MVDKKLLMVKERIIPGRYCKQLFGPYILDKYMILQ